MEASAPDNPPHNEAVSPPGSPSTGRPVISGKPPPRKRRRLVISCTECHRRKEKCDRNLPCLNCQSRNKPSSCHYETPGKPIPSRRQCGRQPEADTDSATNKTTTHSVPPGSNPAAVSSSVATQGHGKHVATGHGLTGIGYVHNGSTLGFLKTIENKSVGNRLTSDAGITATDQAGSLGIREKYRALIRQLPDRGHVERLVDIYFREFDWHLDIDVFKNKLSEWYSVPFTVLLESGPLALSPDLRVFPALLFQALANALIILPKNVEAEFGTLKYAGDMTFEDLGSDYSECGNSILALLGKRQMTETTVLAGFLRCGFLKYTGMVTESWHQVASCIRDAQELGVHSDELDPRPDDEKSEESQIMNHWKIQQRRRLWVSLASWDLHASVILGRPPAIDPTAPMPTPPIDAPLPTDRPHTYPIPRSPSDHPTQLTRSIWVSKAILPLKAISGLDKEIGRGPEVRALVDSLHQSILQSEMELPGYFAFDRPDTRFDSHPDCAWVPMARMLIKQITATSVMALHRRHVFTWAHSRRQAMLACLTILEVQRVQFATLPPHQYKQFTLFFGPFDAAVLIAAVYILLPRENGDLLEECLNHFRWTIDRFVAIESRNKMAKTALGVLRGVEVRLHKAVEKQVNLQATVATDILSVISSATPSISKEQTRSKAAKLGNSMTTVMDGRSHHKYNTRWRAVGPAMSEDHGAGLTSASSRPKEGSSRNTNRSRDAWEVFGWGNPPPGSRSHNTASAGPVTGTASNLGDDADNIPISLPPTQDNTMDQNLATLEAETMATTAVESWDFPTDFDFSSIAPIFPIGDLLYHDLVGIPEAGEGGRGLGVVENRATAISTISAGDGLAAEDQVQVDDQQHLGGTTAPIASSPSTSTPWLFEGEFAQDSLWSLLNQYGPV